MSMAAIYELDCCKRLFVFGRYHNSDSMCRVACTKCGVLKPERHSNATFLTHVDDANLKTKDVRRRILNQKEEAYVRGTMRRVQQPNEAGTEQGKQP